MGAIEAGQNLNFAIPSSRLVSLLQKTTSVTSFPAKGRPQISVNDPVSGEWVGTNVWHGYWEYRTGIYTETEGEKSKRPFTLKLSLMGEKVDGRYQLQNPNFVIRVKGTWTGKTLTLTGNDFNEDGALNATHQFNLSIDGDRIWGEEIGTNADDTREKLRFKLGGIRKR